MTMTNDEILKSYKEAKEPKKQVGILAELNLCSKEKIKEILREMGVSEKELPAPRKKQVKINIPASVPEAQPEAQPEEAEAIEARDDEMLLMSLDVFLSKMERELESIRAEYTETEARYKRLIERAKLELERIKAQTV